MSEYCREIGSIKRMYILKIYNCIFTLHRCFKFYLFYKHFTYKL